jgi:hypothetical protein
VPAGVTKAAIQVSTAAFTSPLRMICSTSACLIGPEFSLRSGTTWEWGCRATRFAQLLSPAHPVLILQPLYCCGVEIKAQSARTSRPQHGPVAPRSIPAFNCRVISKMFTDFQKLRSAAANASFSIAIYRRCSPPPTAPRSCSGRTITHTCVHQIDLSLLNHRFHEQQLLTPKSQRTVLPVHTQ